jgi:superoxide reductase
MDRRDFVVTLLTGASLSIIGFASGIKPPGVTTLASAKEGYLTLTNPDNPTPMEKKHVPLIDAPSSARAGQWIDVRILVGFRSNHPSKKGHWIRWIQLISDGKEVAKSLYPEGGVCSSSAAFKIRLVKNSRLQAVANCNLHGTWISEAVFVTVS